MIDCPVCKAKLVLSRLNCSSCGLVIEGNLTLPRLARLNVSERNLAEQMLLCGGNLKELAENLGISYPTLRKRVDEMIASLNKLKKADEEFVASLLDGIQKGTIKSEEGIRKIREVQGEI